MRDRRTPWRSNLSCGVVLVLVLALALLLIACGDDDDPDAGAAATSTTPASKATSPQSGDNTLIPTGLGGELTVFAAASLSDAFEEVQALLEDANPDLDIIFSFAGSQQLVTQLAEGADADVFASANASQMTAAQDAETIAGDPVVFVRNRLAIVVPSDNPADVREPADLATDALKLVVANPAVPVGGYTLAMLDLISADPAFGTEFRASVEANFVSLEDNVKQVVTKVQLGEADAGIVYVSDVTPDVREGVQLIEIPDEFNIIANYPIALVVGSDAALAQAFIDYLLSPSGQAVLAEWGFTPVDE